MSGTIRFARNLLGMFESQNHIGIEKLVCVRLNIADGIKLIVTIPIVAVESDGPVDVPLCRQQACSTFSNYKYNRVWHPNRTQHVSQ
jgi:hypothetical protein